MMKNRDYPFEKGYLWCAACEKYIHPVFNAEEIGRRPEPFCQTFHKKEYCVRKSMYASRLRHHSRGKKARLLRQEKATYY